MAYGGAGPLHAVAVARELGIGWVIITAAPGVFSAFGMLFSDLRYDYVRTHLMQLAEAPFQEIETVFNELERNGREAIAATSVKPQQIVVKRALDMRYVGQEHVVTVDVPIDHLPAALDGPRHPLEKIVVVLVPVRFAIEVSGNFGQPFIADDFDVFLHEVVIVAPTDPGRAYRRLFGPRGDLMRMQIVQAELIDQRLFDFLVEDEKPVGFDDTPVEFERLRHVPIDIDYLAVEAVARQIGNVVLAV